MYELTIWHQHNLVKADMNSLEHLVATLDSIVSQMPIPAEKVTVGCRFSTWISNASKTDWIISAICTHPLLRLLNV